MKKVIIFLITLALIIPMFFIKDNVEEISIENSSYKTGANESKIQTYYNNLKNTIEADTNRTTFNAFDENINDARCALGIGFNFGLQFDWTSNDNSKTRRYRIRISVGNNDTEYYYYDSYVSELANLYNYGYPNSTPNRTDSSLDYANLELTENTNVTTTSTSPINNIKIYLSNTYSEAIGEDVIVDLKYLKLLDKNGNDIINDTSILKQYTTQVSATNETVVTIPLNTTVGDFYGTNSKIQADIQLDDYISDYKNNPQLIYTHSMNGYGPTDAELQFLKDEGFTSIRLPVTWYTHMDSTGTIDPEWFTELNAAVDRVLSYGFYVIVNIHQEGGKYGWIKADQTDFARNEYLYRYMVLQIAENFKNYNDKLILEGPNEVTNYQKQVGILSSTPQSDIDTHNLINQIFVDEVRRTGYNNKNRFLMVATWYAYRANLSHYVLPTDSADNKIFTELHDYTIRSDGTLASLEYLSGEGASYLKKYNIVIGEYGILRTENLTKKLQLMNKSVPLGLQMGIPMILWDEGGGYAIMKKNAAEWDTTYNSDQVAAAITQAYEDNAQQLCAVTSLTKDITITKKWIDDVEDGSTRPKPKIHLVSKDSVTAQLPSEYQEIEYFTTSGGYIDTDIPFNESYTIYGDGNSKGAGSNGSIIDGFDSKSKRTGFYMLTGSVSSPNLRWQVYWTGMSLQEVTGATAGIDMTQRYQFTQNSSGITFTQGSNTYTFNYSANSTPSTGTSNYRIAGNKQNNRSEIYFYNAKIYDSADTLLHDFIPCYKKDTNKIGVYDIINDVFYPSTGLITSGPDVDAAASIEQTSVDSKWVMKDSHTWTYTFTVDNDDTEYFVYEEAMNGYMISNDIDNHKIIENDEATITNKALNFINKVKVTKKWYGDTNYLDKRPNDITVRLEEAPVTMFIAGEALSNRMKIMSGTSSPTISTVNTNITAIKRSSTLVSGLTDSLNKVSTNDSAYPIYMWYSDGTIYYYTEATFVYLNTSAKYMFSNFRALSNIDELANFNTSRVTDMGFMFQNDISITDLSALSDWDVSCVQSMKMMFFTTNDLITTSGGMHITSLSSFLNWDTQSLTNLEQAFKGFTQIVSLEGLENWDVSNVTSLRQTFQYNNSLMNYNSIKQIEGWDVSAVTDFTNMFLNTPARAASTFSFTNRAGSINSASGTYTTSVAANPKTYNPKTPTAASYTSGTWTKNGDTWTYIFDVPTETTQYYVYEDAVTDYTSDALSTNKKLEVNGLATINNTLQTGDITVKKYITGNMASTDDTFNFTVKVFNTNNEVVTGQVNIIDSEGSKTLNSTSNGFTISMKHNEQVVIKDIPINYSYSIEESDIGYTEYYKIEKTSDNTTVVAQTTGIKAESTLTENHTVSFTNNKEASVNTGMYTPKKSYILMIIITVIGLIVIKKKLFKKETVIN